MTDLDAPLTLSSDEGGILDLFCKPMSAIECDYFHESGFYKFRDGLDGVVIEKKGEITLLINDHSVQADRLLASRFAKTVPVTVIHPTKYPGPINPRYYADCITDRRATQTTLAYVEKKYLLGQARLVEMQRFGAMVSER